MMRIDAESRNVNDSYDYRTAYGFVDKEFYAREYPDVQDTGLDPVAHYLSVGWLEGRDPSPSFSTELYIAENADVKASGENPLLHYIAQGFVEGRRTHPSSLLADAAQAEHDLIAVEACSPPDDQAPNAWQIELIRRELDQDFYARQLSKLGQDPQGLDLAVHYERLGAKMGLDPTDWFSTSEYLLANSDVAHANVNPFAHYVGAGREEGRSLSLASQIRGDDNAQSAADAELIRGEFDEAYYKGAYTDIALAEIDPLLHFVLVGWREGRNPNAIFSTSDYLEMYPDIAATDYNPFVHYIMAGRAEGRKPRQNLGFRYDILKGLVPLDGRIANARRWGGGERPQDVGDLIASFSKMKRSGGKNLFLTVSHDDFTRNLGGVQLCLQREANATLEAGYDHIHMFPAVALPSLELEDEAPTTGVLVNGEHAGYYSPAIIAEASKATGLGAWDNRRFALHSLLGHNPEALLAVLQALNLRDGFFWIHDFTSACAGFHLMRNDVQFCGAPPVGSSACEICVYMPRRLAHMQAHQRLFEALALTVISPSVVALNLWHRGTALKGVAEHVHPHCRLVERLQDANSAEPKEVPPPGRRGTPDEFLRVAFIGLPTAHKGWPVFKDLATKYGKDGRYAFFHLGVQTEVGLPIAFEPVAVSAGDPDAMVRAIERLGIDTVILWSICPETFCLTAHEAAAAGAAVIVMRDSGNAARFVADENCGLVLENEKELDALFHSGNILSSARRRRPSRTFTARFSNMTADFFGATP